MRVSPLLGRHAWFGPRRVGWGWAPVGWQGWTATAVGLVVVVAAPVFWPGAGVAASIAAIAALVLLCVLKGTSPGGTREWRHFERVRAGTVEDGFVQTRSKTGRAAKLIIALLVGVPMAGMLGVIAVATAAPSLIGPPASVSVSRATLDVDLRGPYHLLALRSGISVPFERVVSARVVDDARVLPRGRRRGTYIPGGLIAGTFGSGRSKAMWALQHDRALVIELRGEPFAALVLEVSEPTEVLRELTAAGVNTSP